MNKRYLVALDQGTTSSRAVVFTIEGRMIGSAAQEFPQHYPNPGWVEHDPGDILSTQIESLRAAVRNTGIDRLKLRPSALPISAKLPCCGIEKPARGCITPLCGSAAARRPMWKSWSGTAMPK